MTEGWDTKPKGCWKTKKGTSRQTEPFRNVITIITHVFLYCAFHLMIPECIRYSHGIDQDGFVEFILTQLRDLTHVIFLFTSPRFWLCPTSRDRSMQDCHHSWRHFSSWTSTRSPGMAMPITVAEQRAAAILPWRLSQLQCQPPPAAPKRRPWQPALPDLQSDCSYGSERAQVGRDKCFLDIRKHSQATLG